MVGSRGIEPPTYSLGNCRSILLSYDPIKHIYDYICNSASRTNIRHCERSEAIQIRLPRRFTPRNDE